MYGNIHHNLVMSESRNVLAPSLAVIFSVYNFDN